MSADRWYAHRHGDIDIDSQRWYCHRCGCKYKASWGQVVIVERWSAAKSAWEFFYMRAECPPWTIEDIRALYHEEEGVVARHKPTTPEEFFNQINSILGITTTTTPCTGLIGGGLLCPPVK